MSGFGWRRSRVEWQCLGVSGMAGMGRKADGLLLATIEGSSHWLATAYHLRCTYDALPQSMAVHGVDDARVRYFAALVILAVHPLGSHWSPAGNGVVASSRRGLPMAFSLS